MASAMELQRLTDSSNHTPNNGFVAEPKDITQSLRLKQRRIINRNGENNTENVHLRTLKSRFVQDFYTTLVDIQWRWLLLAFFLAFFLCWLIFGALYYVIMIAHGDDKQTEDSSSERIPCVMNANTFTAMFLYSVETQTTIGYGYRYTTEECPPVIVVMCLQSITGVIIQAFLVGVVLAKLTRSKIRKNTLLFSKVAVVSMRNGQLCLQFRIADLRASFIIGASVKAKFISYFYSFEGEYVPYYQYELGVKVEGNESDSMLLVWPLNVIHVIDRKSPLYRISSTDSFNENFEIIVYLEGTCESTGTCVQERFSYVSSNIQWSHRFVNIINYSDSSKAYQVDFQHFNTTMQVPTPVCSAEELDRVRAASEEEISAMKYGRKFSVRRSASNLSIERSTSEDEINSA